jgi:glyoxylase I family protein
LFPPALFDLRNTSEDRDGSSISTSSGALNMAMKVQSVTPLMQVYEMQASIAFYREVLGFEVVHLASEPSGHLWWAMLKLGGATVMLNSKYEGDSRPAVPEAVTGRDDVTLYFGVDDVDQAYRELRGKTLSVEEPRTMPYGMRQMNVRDPDGFHLCFQQPVAQ